jgi:hypothetical protein
MKNNYKEKIMKDRIVENRSKDPIIHLMDMMGGGTIEDSEARGQKDLIDSCQLPVKFNESMSDKEIDSIMKSWGVVLHKPTAHC